MEIFLMVIGALLLIIGLGAVEAWLLMLLINWILVQLGVDYQLTFWVTWAIMVVCNCLFKSHNKVDKN